MEEEQEDKLLQQDKIIQSISELGVHGKTYQPDDIGKVLQEVGFRIARDLGRIHELTDGKANVAFILEVTALYLHLIETDPEVITRAPYEIFNEDLIPFINNSELTVEENPDGFEVSKESV